MLAEFDSQETISPDLRVGEIRAVRTFDLRSDGTLWPISTVRHGPWVDGVNTARCGQGRGHTPAAPGCGCGFWAYGGHRMVSGHQPLAVIACWGRVVPGTRGLRAQHARIEGVWLPARTPRDQVRWLRQRYPSLRVYRWRRVMLKSRPPTRLDSYEPEPKRGPRRPFARRASGVGGARRDRRRWWMAPFGELEGGPLFSLIWLALALAMLAGTVPNVVDLVEARLSGIRTTGHALSTWTETHTSLSTDAHGVWSRITTTDHYTRVRFAERNGAIHVETVSGSYKPPAPVALVYQPGSPRSVRSAGDATDTDLLVAVFWLVVSVGFVLFCGCFVMCFFTS